MLGSVLCAVGGDDQVACFFVALGNEQDLDLSLLGGMEKGETKEGGRILAPAGGRSKRTG